MPARTKIDAALIERARELLAEPGATQYVVARDLGVSQSALSRALRRGRPKAETAPEGEPETEVRGDEAAFYGLTLEDLADAEALLRRRGFDPAEWEVTKASVTEWGRDPETGAPYQRLKVDLKRRRSILGVLPAEHGAVPAVTRARTRASDRGDRPQLGVIFADQHAPFHDPGLHACALAFLADLRPDFGVLAGDTLDFPSPSRHRRNPKWHATPQETVDAGYQVLRDYVEAHPRTSWRKLLGNHDVRVRNFLLESSAPDLATLRPAATGEPEDDLSPALAIRRLLHLDTLGIDCVEPEGEYADEQVVVCRNLAVLHGERTGKGAAEAELARYGHSIAFGHLHTAGTTYRTTWDMDGATTHVALQVATMARIEGGLGYTRRPNWQQGFATVQVWPDGRFHLEHATYTAGTLFWRDRRWTA